jgi:hypothetical protein
MGREYWDCEPITRSLGRKAAAARGFAALPLRPKKLHYTNGLEER